jgi:Ca2+-binding RTX toxin-like protein
MRRLLLSSTTALVLFVGGLGLQPASADGYPPCTITGTSANETITGTEGNDVICTGGGNDTVNALGGNDIIIVSGAGIDTINGGSGNDTIDASLGTDSTIDAGSGDDTVYGTPGDDEITAGDGSDTVNGEAGNDTITGGDGNDNLQGDTGNDTITGDTGDDTITGGDGNDSLNGTAGDDSLIGGEGADTLRGGDGNDALSGGEGNDKLAGDNGINTVDGGPGFNVCQKSDETSSKFCNTFIQTSFSEVAIVSGYLRTFDGAPVVANVGFCGPFACTSVQTSSTGHYSIGVIPGASYSIYSSGQASSYGGSAVVSPLPLSWSVAWKSVGVAADMNLDLVLPQTREVTLSFLDSSGASITGVTVSNESTNFGGGCGSWCPDDSTYSSVQWSGIPNADSQGKIHVQTFGFTDNAMVVVRGVDKNGIRLTKRLNLMDQTLAPTNLQFENISKYSESVSWSASAFNGGARVTEYVVEISDDNGVSWSAIALGNPLNQSVVIEGLSDDKDYKIRIAARSVLGLSEYLLGDFNTKRMIPSAPKSLVYSSMTISSLLLGWGLPDSNGGSAITDYQVEVTSNGSNSWTVIPHTASNSLGFNVSNLLPGRTYQFRVAAVTSVGLGAYSNVITVTTAGGVTPNAPASFTVGTVKTNAASVSWSAVTATSKVSNYLLDVSTDGSTWTSVSKKVSTSTSLSLSGLKVGTTYQVRVAAVNANGVGDYVYGSFTTLATVSTAPTGLVSSGVSGSGFTLNWTAPASNGGSAISDYVVEINGGGFSWSPIVHDPSANTTITVTGLNPAVKYSIRVKALNSVGVSKASSALNVTTLAVLPATPVISLKSITATGAVITWTAPNNGGAKISDYLAEYSTDNGQTWKTVVKTASSSTSLTLKSLKTKTSYLFRISAKNTVGYSNPSQNLGVTTS